MGGSVPNIAEVGILAEPGLAHDFRQEVASVLERNSLSFPGAQPVSFARKHLQELQQRECVQEAPSHPRYRRLTVDSYYVCEKSDGIRCLLYFTEDSQAGELHYLIDRKNDYYYVPHLHFPRASEKPDTPIDFASFHTATMLDGELLYDEYPDGRRVLKFLVFDCLLLDGINLMQRTLDKRLAYFMEKIFKPYEALCKSFPQDVASFRFKLEKKSFQLGYGVEMMFKDIIPRLPHGSDGLIFTCRETPYKFGTDEHILKWKPADENTIDFKLGVAFPPLPAPANGTPDPDTWEFDYDALPTLTLYVHHGDRDHRPFAPLHLTDAEWSRLQAWCIEHDDGLDGQIVECHRDASGRWRFNRFRDDKREANHASTVTKVLESIEDGVSREELVAVAGQVRVATKRRAAEAAERQKTEERRRAAERMRADEARRAAQAGKRKADEAEGAPGVDAKRHRQDEAEEGYED